MQPKPSAAPQAQDKRRGSRHQRGGPPQVPPLHRPSQRAPRPDDDDKRVQEVCRVLRFTLESLAHKERPPFDAFSKHRR